MGLEKNRYQLVQKLSKYLSFLYTSKLSKYIVVYTRLKALEKPCYNMWSINFKIKWALKKKTLSVGSKGVKKRTALIPEGII